MARLPTVGGDYGNWGTVLNEFLETAHNADGTLKLDVQTIANLKAIDVATLTDKQQALVAGYSAPGDGGGGVFYYDAAASDADNGGTIFAPNAGAGRWLRVYSGAVNVKWFGATGDGSTDDTSSVQACISGGGEIIFPAGTYMHGPLTVSAKTRIVHQPGSAVIPVFSAGSLQKLYNVTAADSCIEGLTVESLAGTITENKYLVYAGPGADGFSVRGAVFSSISASDGNTGLTNLKVVHGIYVASSSDVTVENCRINGISGSGIFLNDVVGAVIRNNHLTNTRWYSITVDNTGYDVLIEGNTIDGTDALARYWGGSINLMSQTGDPKNERIIVRGNKITGVHNYGAVIRVLSVEDSVIDSNVLYNCTYGTILGGPLQYIAVDRRGTAEGAAENGPCRNVVISKNILRAGTATDIAIYLKNQYKATRDPHENIIISNNAIWSESPSLAFQCGISIHGMKSGFDGICVEENLMRVLTITGSPVGGAIGVVSTNAAGEVRGLAIEGNRIIDINAAVPASSFQAGIYVQTYVANPRIRGNEIVNFFYGLRTAANVVSPSGLNDQNFVGCLTDVLYGTAPVGGALDMSLGTALPVSGVYRSGHIRQLTNAAASTSWGWIVTTAGGAMTAMWASGQTYVAGAWYRNAAGRVYELITAGGGTTSVEPTGTTVGADETGADGYVWRCRATTSARWATLPALGTVVALP